MVSAHGRWDIRPFEAWIADDFLPSLWVGPGPANYGPRPSDHATALYGAGDVACILYTLDRLDDSATKASAWLDVLSQFQDTRSGFFVDPDGMLSTAHNTAFAVAAMKLFEPDLHDGVMPRAPILFGQLISDPASAERYAAALDWRNNCYEAGENLIGHASTFFNVADVVPPTWFDWLVAYVEDTKLDPANGMVGIDKPASGDTDQIGGTLHFDFFWAALERGLPFARARAAALCGLQLESGLWDPNNPWWLTFDAVYMLARALPELTDEQAAEVRHAIARAVAALAARATDADQRAGDFVQPWIGAHMLTGALSLFACAQQALGFERVITTRPLRLVLDRRPYI